jgi:excisionase family DNA binding protein
LENSRPVYTTGQAATALGLSIDTIKRLWERGLIEGYLTSPIKGGRLRLYRDSVEEFDRQRKSRPTPGQ